LNSFGLFLNFEKKKRRPVPTCPTFGPDPTGLERVATKPLKMDSS
jgi:hypothetical protein